MGVREECPASSSSSGRSAGTLGELDERESGGPVAQRFSLSDLWGPPTKGSAAQQGGLSPSNSVWIPLTQKDVSASRANAPVRRLLSCFIEGLLLEPLIWTKVATVAELEARRFISFWELWES